MSSARLNKRILVFCSWVLVCGVCVLPGADTAFAADTVDEPAVASGAAADAAAPEAKPTLTEGEQKKLDDMTAGLELQRSQVARLEEAIATDKDTAATPVLQVRLAKAWIALLRDGNAFAETVYNLKGSGAVDSQYWDQAIAELNAHPDIAQFANRELTSRMVLPASDLSPVEQATTYAKTSSLVEIQDRLFELLHASLELSKKYDLDVTAETDFLRTRLLERAENNSVLLDMAMNDVKSQQVALEVLPDNADVKAQLAVATSRVSGLAKSLKTAVSMMKQLDLDTGAYSEQIIRGTGQITADTVSVSVVGSFVKSWSQKLSDMVLKNGPDIIIKLIVFILIILLALKLAGVAQRVVDAALTRSQVGVSQLLRNMLVSVARNVVLAIGVLIALSQVGLSLAPVLAGMGVAGFVIGFAMQDTLSNFASGLMILFYRPFDIGDVVEAGGVSGTVSHMSLVSTTILTFDNQTLVVPNNKIWGDVIKNVTAQRTRRVDLLFSIAYDDDIDQAEKVLRDIVAADDRVLETPAPVIRLHQLGESSVNFVVRPWVKTADYWDVYWGITRAVKQGFDAAGISIPFPQLSLHIDSPANTETAQMDTPGQSK